MQKMRTESGFVRIEGHSLQVGKVVAYQLHGFNFRIVVHRDGIEIEGKSPVFPVVGLRVISDILRCAQIHYKHLASCPPGELQTLLPESEVIKRLETEVFITSTPQAEPVAQEQLYTP